MKTLKAFDKYHYYKESVQDPESDIKTFTKIYKSIFKKTPRIFREDFCGTFYFGSEWVKSHSKNQAIVVDLDKEPINYGKTHHLFKMTESQKKRLRICVNNVLDTKLPKAQIINVNNFSYCIFKQRDLLLKYFINVKKTLLKQGIFILDVFGGSDCFSENEDQVKHDKFNYYWEQKNFDPINNFAKFEIHFKRPREKKRQAVFSYDWRLWSVPELKDILLDAGFSKIHSYWEQCDKQGEGTGVLKKTFKEESCETWVTYLVCES